MAVTSVSTDRRSVIDQLETLLQQNGFVLLDTPIIQPADLFLTRAGDQIADHLFTFERSGEQLALRPEFTSSAIKQYLDEFPVANAIKRWLFSGVVFEDYAQAGEYQKYSIGLELLGAATPESEAEIIGLAAQAMRFLGVTDWFIEIGHVGLTRHLLSRFGIEGRVQQILLNRASDSSETNAQLQLLLDKLTIHDADLSRLDTADQEDSRKHLQIFQMMFANQEMSSVAGGRSRQEILQRFAKKQQRTLERDKFQDVIDFLNKWSQFREIALGAFEKLAKFVDAADDVGQGNLKQWQEMIRELEQKGVPLEKLIVRPALARNWDYYTGVVFEICSESGKRLVGGGRYDDFARLIGANRDVPAVGLAFYIDELMPLLP